VERDAGDRACRARGGRCGGTAARGGHSHRQGRGRCPTSDQEQREARIILIGDADWVANGNLGAFFNRELLVNALHWLTGSEDLIVGAPKRLRASRLDMTTADQRNLFRFGVLLLPEALLIGGIVVWLRRKSL
jgi:hypothetical protein